VTTPVAIGLGEGARQKILQDSDEEQPLDMSRDQRFGSRARFHLSRWCGRATFSMVVSLALSSIPSASLEEPLSSEGRALRDLLVARGNLRDARREGGGSPKLAQQGLGRWLKAGVHPANTTLVQRVEEPREQEQQQQRSLFHPEVSGKLLNRAQDLGAVHCEWNDKLERLKTILHEDLAQEQLAELLRNAGNTLENSPVLVFILNMQNIA